jgi:hypothetical protein
MTTPSMKYYAEICAERPQTEKGKLLGSFIRRLFLLGLLPTTQSDIALCPDWIPVDISAVIFAKLTALSESHFATTVPSSLYIESMRCCFIQLQDLTDPSVEFYPQIATRIKDCGHQRDENMDNIFVYRG